MTTINLYDRDYLYIYYSNNKLRREYVYVSLNGYMDRVKRIWYLSPMRAATVQASLRIRAVSPEPSLLAHTSSESRGTFRQKARSLALLNGWACAVKICHDGMLEDTNSLDGAHMMLMLLWYYVIPITRRNLINCIMSHVFKKEFEGHRKLTKYIR